MNLKTGTSLVLVPVLFGCAHGIADDRTDRLSPPSADASEKERPTSSLVRDVAASLQTDRLRYLVSEADGIVTGQIEYVFKNRGETPVYFANCRGKAGVGLEKQVEGSWVMARGEILLTCLSPPIVVGPGDEFSDVVHLQATRAVSTDELGGDALSGVYRLVMDVLQSYDEDARPFGERLPLEERISNRFYLDVE